ncbi:unknown [Firmicutes bacterium CAG:884]|nr:unknown [Firmicutes bacterium CAG:884]
MGSFFIKKYDINFTSYKKYYTIIARRGKMTLDQTLDRLDISMKKITLDLIAYREEDPRCEQTLDALNNLYQIAIKVLNLKRNDKYTFVYSDLEQIKTILTNAGYIEKSKPLTR